MQLGLALGDERGWDRGTHSDWIKGKGKKEKENNKGQNQGKVEALMFCIMISP